MTPNSLLTFYVGWDIFQKKSHPMYRWKWFNFSQVLKNSYATVNNPIYSEEFEHKPSPLSFNINMP